MNVLLTCEHASNAVPARWRALIRANARVLATHQAYDIGAKVAARALSKSLAAPLHEGTITRLLVDLNRSVGHRDLFSAWSARLDAGARAELVAGWHAPFRAAALATLQALRARGAVTHLSIHSFTPRLSGVDRTCDLALLYDPRRPGERALAGRLRDALGEVAPGLRVRRNYPYRGAADGHTSALRKRFDAREYVGLEIEFNQARLRTPAEARAFARLFERALRLAL